MAEPLVLLHGIGSHRHMWAPVLPLLEPRYDVHALDMPGFGDRPPLSDEPSPQRLAQAIAEIMDERDLETAHVAGNSLGGWVALELAKLGRTRSVCALSPAGFWEGWERAFMRVSLVNARTLTKALLPVAEPVNAKPAVRKALYGQFFEHGERLSHAEAVASARNLGTCPGWNATLKAMAPRTFEGGDQVPAPVTIAWGEHDKLLLRRQAARAKAALPQARHIVLTGCGHVPTYDDPAMVTDAIVTSA
jgi:pimeloyl-ACP methyl ester carboxylesterase